LGDSLLEPRTEWPLVKFCQAQNPEEILKHDPLVIDRVLSKRAIFINQFESLGLEDLPATFAPFVCARKFRKKSTDGPQTDRLANPVIVPLAESIVEVCLYAV